MSIGNLSQTIVKAPNFFLYQNGKKVETFRIYRRRRLFNERTLVEGMNELNFNNNYRHYYHPIKSERCPVLSSDEPKLTNSHDVSAFELKSDKTFSHMTQRFNDYLSKASLSKLSSEDFKGGVQTNISSLVEKLNRSRKEVLELKQLGTNSNDMRFLSKTFPKIASKQSENGRATNNSIQLMKNKRIYDEEELFKQTLREKVGSLRLVSNRVKEEISHRKCSIDGWRSFANRFHYVPTFKEAIDNAMETLGRGENRLYYSMK